MSTALIFISQKREASVSCLSLRTGSWIPRVSINGFLWHLHVGSSFICWMLFSTFTFIQQVLYSFNVFIVFFYICYLVVIYFHSEFIKLVFWSIINSIFIIIGLYSELGSSQEKVLWSCIWSSYIYISEERSIRKLYPGESTFSYIWKMFRLVCVSWDLERWCAQSTVYQ